MAKKYLLFSFFFCLNIALIFLFKLNYFIFEKYTSFIWIPDFIFFVYLLKENFKKKEIKLFLKVFFVFFLFKLIGSVSIFNQYSNIKLFILDIIRTPLNYFFPVLLYLSFRDLKKIDLKNIFNCYKIILYLVLFTIIIGFLFSITVFKTYHGDRFGYSGILFWSSFASYFTIINLLILFFYNKKIENVHNLLLISFIVAFLVGTKAVYLFLGVFALYYFIDSRLYKSKNSYIFLSVLFLVFFIFKTQLSYYFSKTFKSLIDLYNNNDLQTFIFSYRNLKFDNILDFTSKNWSFVNYLIGGVNRKEMLAELSLFDFILNFGVIGLASYLLLLLYFIKKEITLKTSKFIFIIFFLITALAGNFFNNTVIAYPLVLLLILISRKKEVVTQKNI